MSKAIIDALIYPESTLDRLFRNYWNIFSKNERECLSKIFREISYKRSYSHVETKFIDLASSINESMPQYVIERVGEILSDRKKTIENSNILVIGVAYKKDVKDLRESPAINVISLLQRQGAEVSYHDPYFPFLKINGIDMRPIKLRNENLKKYDCTLVMADHSNVDYKFLANKLKLIFDTRNIFSRLNIKSKNIIKL